MKEGLRFLQLITGVHYVHHINYSYGWKIPFTGIGYFKRFGFKWLRKNYHNCTTSGIY